MPGPAHRGFAPRSRRSAGSVRLMTCWPISTGVGAAHRLAGRRDRVSGGRSTMAVQLGPLLAMIADRARLRVMLASVARTFHVGPLADCFFDPATALCLKRVTTPDPAQPLTALCEPTRCPNACITARHRPPWERETGSAPV